MATTPNNPYLVADQEIQSKLAQCCDGSIIMLVVKYNQIVHLPQISGRRSNREDL